VNCQVVLSAGTWITFEPLAWVFGVVVWALGGGVLLLVGARWMAGLAGTTFWQSVKAWVAASVCCAIVLLLGGLCAYQFDGILWLVAALIVVTLPVVFFGIVKAMLAVTARKAVLASIPLIGVNGLVLVISLFISGMFSAERNVVVTELAAIEHGVEQFQLDMGRYPTTEEGLVVVRAYLAKAPTDPWGRPYQYACPGEHNTESFDLWSLGPNGNGRGDAGLNNWTGL